MTSRSSAATSRARRWSARSRNSGGPRCRPRSRQERRLHSRLLLTEGDHMNLTRIISIKERVAISSEWKPDERDFILECISVAIKNAKPRPDLSMEDFRITVIALRKAAHTSHPDLAA